MRAQIVITYNQLLDLPKMRPGIEIITLAEFDDLTRQVRLLVDVPRDLLSGDWYALNVDPDLEGVEPPVLAYESWQDPVYPPHAGRTGIGANVAMQAGYDPGQTYPGRAGG